MGEARIGWTKLWNEERKERGKKKKRNKTEKLKEGR